MRLKWKRGKTVIDQANKAHATSWTTHAIDGALKAIIIHVTVSNPEKWVCHVTYEGRSFSFTQATGLKSAKEAVNDFVRKQGH